MLFNCSVCLCRVRWDKLFCEAGGKATFAPWDELSARRRLEKTWLRCGHPGLVANSRSGR